MSSTAKTMINLLFPLVALAGSWLILQLEHLDEGYALFLPAILVGCYGIIISFSLSGTEDRDYAEHQIDTVYFLGFLYTLVSLTVFFYRFNPALLQDNWLIAQALYYIGISVTTSIAGVLFRSIARSGYLKKHGEEKVDLEKSYILLKSIAESFSSSYEETFQTVRRYFDERMETSAALGAREKEYLESLERFIGVMDKFSAELTATREELQEAGRAFSRDLAAQREPIAGIAESSLAFSHAAGRIRSELEALPMSSITGGCEQFRKEISELDTVLDNFVSLLELKVEKMGV
ncbi:hypothetical protein [Marispirochaeta aestuarii]|uniref:hypothetical protein n=1 Tax=Marispirochaeta aestuarii TaxID=1963862 RepID=UPI0029C9475E|nr:hypothetical protein [Marispirochaeta aestuarii]